MNDKPYFVPGPSNQDASRAFRPSPPKPAGHDTVLRAIQNKGSMITIIFVGGDDTMTGTLVARDKYTLTVRDKGVRHVIFKHDIRSFSAEESVDIKVS